MSNVQLFVGSSECMPQVVNDSVSLTVTSPPYYNSVDYDRHASDSDQDFRTRDYSEGFDGYEDFLDLMSRIFMEVHRATKPGGFCCIVVGTVLDNGHRFPLPSDLVVRLCSEGWELHEQVTWNKVTGGVKRAGVTIQHPYPGYYRANLMTEQILVLRKPGPPIYQGRGPHEREAARIPIDDLFVRDVANDVWHIPPVPPRHLDHPCPFPEEIPFRLISLYSYPGDLILEPFLGSGQTTKVAHHLGRSAVGYDLVEKYVEYARARIDEPLSLRPEQIVARFDKVPLGTLNVSRANGPTAGVELWAPAAPR
jgi:modification methylase